MKRIKSIVAAVIAVVTLSSCTSNESSKDTGEQIPILAYCGVEEHTVERYLELKETGCTHNFSYFENIEDQATAMDAAAKAGIKQIIYCPELLTEPEMVASRFKNHPALAGYHITDEPPRNDFPKWGEIVRRVQAVDSIHFCYVNLLPNYASKKQLGTETYREHVQLFIKEVPVPFLSFDHYPIQENAVGEHFIWSELYENLEIFSDEARKAGKPFWAFARTVGNKGKIPVPTLAEIRLQVFSNLAYGAQGIQYFTYWTPKAVPGYQYDHGPIDYDAKKRTETYEIIKQMSEEIKNLSPVFMNAKVISTGHTGDDIPTGTRPLGKLPDVIKTFDADGGAVVSVLEKGDMSFLVIVNRNLKNTLPVKVEGSPKLQRILKDGTTVPASKYTDHWGVEPGDILIYGWKKDELK